MYIDGAGSVVISRATITMTGGYSGYLSEVGPGLSNICKGAGAATGVRAEGDTDLVVRFLAEITDLVERLFPRLRWLVGILVVRRGLKRRAARSLRWTTRSLPSLRTSGPVYGIRTSGTAGTYLERNVISFTVTEVHAGRHRWHRV